MNESIVITGVAGLIGSRMADWLLSNFPGYEVVGIDNLSGGYIENIDSRITFYNTDCASAEIRLIFERHQPKLVYHFAAYAAEGLSPFIRKFNYQNNLLATANIINESIRQNVERLVFTSSMAVYGAGNPLSMNLISLHLLIHMEWPNMLAKWIFKLQVSNMVWIGALFVLIMFME